MEELNGIMNAIHRACAGSTLHTAGLARTAKQADLHFYRAKKNIPVTICSWRDRWPDMPGYDRVSVMRRGIIPKGSCFIVRYRADLLESEYRPEEEGAELLGDYAVLFADPDWEESAIRLSLDGYVSSMMSTAMDTLLQQAGGREKRAESYSGNSGIPQVRGRLRQVLLPAM